MSNVIEMDGEKSACADGEERRDDKLDRGNQALGKRFHRKCYAKEDFWKIWRDSEAKKKMTLNPEKSFATAYDKHAASGGCKRVCYLEMALTVCSMLGMAGFCALCTIFFSYSGVFVLHVCLALIGGTAALIAVLTHSSCALFLHMIVQVVSIVYLLIIAILSISIFFNPKKWKFDNASFLGHTEDEIHGSGAILMIISVLLIPILSCSLAAAIQLFRRIGAEKVAPSDIIKDPIKITC